MPDELNPDSPGYQLNANFSMNYWLSLGARKEQLVMGVGAYGRGFQLVDSNNSGFYAPASGPIGKASYTATDGFWGYNEFCEKFKSEGNEWTIHRVSSHSAIQEIQQRINYISHRTFIINLLNIYTFDPQDTYTVGPYAVKGTDWFSYDDELSTRIKSEYILDNDFAGGMFWSIDTDDFKGFCSETNETFGLIRTMSTVKI